MPRHCWVDVPADSPWGIEVLPYGVAQLGGGRRIVVRIGQHALDAAPVAAQLAPHLEPLLRAPSLNRLMAAGRSSWDDLRAALTGWLTQPNLQAVLTPHLLPVDTLELVLPFDVADYVDFYSSRDHAENLGHMFRPGQPALAPNWLHMPIGYHGRAGTVIVTGSEVTRPCGQLKTPTEPTPRFGPSQRLDIEAEVGFVVGVGSQGGRPVSTEDFADHVFGVVLVNDWSARDIQSWEYVPLGPFLAKSFATSIAAWVTPLAAFADARTAVPAREVPLLPYLQGGNDWGLDIELSVQLNGEVVSQPPFASMYWSAAQQLAHMTVNGASLRTGDLFASGTVSGPGADQRGSFIELSWNGAQPLVLADGSTRSFLEDGDEVTLSGVARRRDGIPVGLGEVHGTIRPAAW